MNAPSSIVVAISLCTSLLAACGSGTVTIGGGGNDGKKVKVVGNLRDVSPVTSRDIVVFVYRIDDSDVSDRCPCPPDPSSSTVGKAQLLESGTTEFSLSGLDSGSFGVVFLLDNAGSSADGTIDPGDPIAILDDIDCDLEDVSGDITITLDDVDIAFSTAPAAECRIGVANPPAAGRARADLVTLSATKSGS